MDKGEMVQDEVRELGRAVIEDFLGCCKEFVALGFMLAKLFHYLPSPFSLVTE